MMKDPNTFEELTAYLDGELSSDEALRVEQRLGTDPDYLAEMQALQKTWDLFDRLPSENCDDSFMRTTLELVVQDAAKTIQLARIRPWVWPLRALLFAAISVILFAVGFATTRAVKLAPYRELVNNLMLIENFNQYEKLGLDFKFLKQLDDRGLFAEDDTYIASSAGELPEDLFVYDQPGVFPPRETIEQREHRLDAMTTQQKNALRRNFKQFEALTVPQRESLQKFHNEFSGHPAHGQLTQVMNSYVDWLETLQPGEKARLLDEPGDKRLVEVANIRNRQAREAFGRVGATKLSKPRDAEYLFAWFKMSIHSKESLIRKRFPSVVAEYQRQNPSARNIAPEALNRFATRQPLNQLVAILIRINRTVVQDLLLQDIRDFFVLRNGLSFEARAIVDEQSPDGQKELVLNWIDAANQAQATISLERLQQFYETLPLEERDELDMMAPENWKNVLTAKFLQHQNQRRNFSDNQAFDETLEDWESFMNGGPIGEF